MEREVTWRIRRESCRVHGEMELHRLRAEEVEGEGGRTEGIVARRGREGGRGNLSSSTESEKKVFQRRCFWKEEVGICESELVGRLVDSEKRSEKQEAVGSGPESKWIELASVSPTASHLSPLRFASSSFGTMPSFFEDDSDSDGRPSPAPQARPPPPPARAGSSSTSGARAGPGPSSFLNRALSSRHSSPEDHRQPEDAYMGGPQDDDGDDGAGDGEGDEEDTRVRRLMRAWVAERAAPSVLRWEGDIVDDLMHKVEQQVRI